MKKAIISAFSFCVCFTVQAQNVYEESDKTIEVIKNGQPLEAPFTGGFNAAQFCEMDLDQDGTMDLIVYDRSRGQVRPYINLGIRDSVAYRYEPQYANKFPLLRSWLLTADYNNDGKMDLFDGEAGIQLWENKSDANGLKFELIGDLKTLYNTGAKPINIPSNSSSLPAIYDIDNDGDIDIFNINPNLGETVDYHRNLAVERGDASYIDFERRNSCWGDFSDDNGTLVLDDCNGTPPGGELSDTTNQSGQQNDHKQPQDNEKDLKHGVSASLTAVDIDGNGSMDLIMSELDSYQSKLLLNEDSISPFVDSRIFSVERFFPNYDSPIESLFPAVFFIDVNNDGKKDMIAGSNTLETFIGFSITSDDIYYYENISTDNSIRLSLQQKNFLLENTLDFGIAAHPVFFDYNKDGLFDLVIGNDGHVDVENNSITGRLELLENIGTKSSPKFELINSNYLDLPSLKLNIASNIAGRNYIPTFGDIDGDGDQDMLLGEALDNVFLFEDTSVNGQPAAFKFHPGPFSGLNIRGLGRTNAPVLYDINGDNVLDLIVSDGHPDVNYFLNFGSATNPVFNIRLDSIIFQGNRTYRYYLEDQINFNLLKIGDSLAVNNASNPDNGIGVRLNITALNPTENYIECKNLVFFEPVDARYNEVNTDAYLTFFDRRWGNFRYRFKNFSNPRIFPYEENGQTQLVVATGNGEVHFFNNIPTTLNPRDTFELFEEGYITNHGFQAFVHGADINDDGLIDLVIGNQAGGIKILIAQYGVGFNELVLRQDAKEESFFDLYPNPANTYVNVALKNNNSMSTNYTLKDINGRLIKQGVFMGSQLSLNTESLPNGVYLIAIEQAAFLETKQLVIKR